jgi:hypothetical protein
VVCVKREQRKKCERTGEIGPRPKRGEELSQTGAVPTEAKFWVQR